jgi:hypothetical protein
VRYQSYIKKYHLTKVRTERPTAYDSSVNVSTKIPRSSSALSILLAYSPMIQMRDAFASGSSSSSKFAHKVGMTPSYVDGYLRKISYTKIDHVSESSQRYGIQLHLHHYNCFLYHVTHSGRNKIKQYVDTSLGGRVNLYRGLSNCLDALANEVDVNFRCVPVMG